MSECGVINADFADLPQEILVKIFTYYVKNSGVSKLLSILKKVCLSWEEATKCPILWENIDDGNLSKKTMLSICKLGRLSRTVNLNLSYVAKELDQKHIALIAKNCPKLVSINLSCGKLHCFKILELLDVSCQLKSINFQNMESSITSKHLRPFLERNGQNLLSINLSNNFIAGYSSLMLSISSLCPNLENLHLLNVSGTSHSFPVTKFQQFCPKLSVLELGSADFSFNNVVTNGFTMLQTFNCGVVEHGLTDSDLLNILKTSSNLKILDVRNCRVTPKSLMGIPCTDLEVLYLCGSNAASDLELGKVLSKWKHSLKDLSISRSTNFSALNSALNALVMNIENPPLEELNLSSSVVAFSTIKLLLSKCKNLHFLNIESCRELPRGTKRTYRNRDETSDFDKRLKCNQF